MTDTPRHQRDLFETPVAPKIIPISAAPQMLELLKALLTEALTGSPINAGDMSMEAGDDKDHA
jgi:hypothetical protein